MESKNPFIQRIHAAPEYLDDYEPITDNDKERYRLRGQNYKFSHPGKFVFIDMPVEFIAMAVDDEQQVKSMLLYLDEPETILETLKIAYGTPSISMDVEGEAEDESGDSQRQTYTSNTWVLNGHRLTMTALRVIDEEKSQLKAQLFTK